MAKIFGFRKKRKEVNSMEDTIVAISTALGVGAISIIRVSGKEAIPIVNKIFKGKDLNAVLSHTIHYGHIVDESEIIDEVLVTVMKAPKTFTVEDVVEINAHGGIATTYRILELLLKNGCRAAEPGEFTKRAFLNGRIDLVEAESVMDLISAKTETNRKMALAGVDGKVSALIRSLRSKIIELLANIEVNIDYPEYEDIAEMTVEELKKSMVSIETELKEILKNSKEGKMIKEGINTSIIGRPNVGKSSILNRLLKEEKAIVTDIEGTTRDVVEGNIMIDGVMLNILDTAGIRKTDNVVEKIGVRKSLELLEQSELVLIVLNNNEILTHQDRKILKQAKHKNHIVIVNKKDLKRNLDVSELETNYIEVSALNDEGIEDIKNRIREMFHLEQLENHDMTYLTNARSIALIEKALLSLEDVKKGIEGNLPIDMVEIDLKNVWNFLGEITGETYQDELIDQLFSQFCLGK